MSGIVCFIDKIGMSGTCCKEACGKIIACDKCYFKKKYNGKEKDEFIYTLWTGELNRRGKNVK